MSGGEAATVALLPALGALLDYPGPDLTDRLALALALAEPHGPAVTQALTSFARALDPLSGAARQEVYTSTFDLAPSCSPYLGVHLFGAEHARRTGLMCGLLTAYQQAGFVQDPGELPDHLATVLRFAPRCPPEEWTELVRHCLQPAVGGMLRALGQGDNPYRGLLAAVQRALTGAGSEPGWEADR